MNSSEISVIVEPVYMPTPWWEETRAGMDGELLRKGSKVKYYFSESIDDLKVDRRSVVILAGETLAWIDAVLQQCEREGIRTVLACSDIDGTTPLVSSITLGRSEAMNEAVRYLFACGKMNICAFAMNPDSPADMRKVEGFISAANQFGILPEDSSIIQYKGSIGDCFDEFSKDISNYDAVICTNDLSAKYLIARLSECGIRVPEDMYVMSFGNTLLGRHTEPSITTVTLDLQELGRQAIKASLFLTGNPDVNSIHVTISCHIIARQSTANTMPEQLAALHGNDCRYSRKSLSSNSDLLLNQLARLEQCLVTCDLTDARILKGIMDGRSYPQLAEELFIADNTLRYRMNRIFKVLHVSSRKELEKIFLKYIPNFSPDFLTGSRT